MGCYADPLQEESVYKVISKNRQQAKVYNSPPGRVPIIIGKGWVEVKVEVKVKVKE
jgi:hypothetical protein